ncbi:MAG TPA: tyrosine-protein phosphatase [Acidimicrobiales bacterium]|nr:tyrosine-protein phosphatase [Acidimicrobiales bacterium]
MTVTVTPSENELLERRIPITGTWNVRHVGGYVTTDGRTTKPYTLIRGDALHGLDDDGRAHLRSLSVRTVIDLRRDTERETHPDLLDDVGARVINLPLFEADRGAGATGDLELTLDGIYRMLVEDRGPAIAAVIRELAAPGALPAVVHCSVGKDRTGVIIALVLSVVGVPDEVIALDFAATGLFLTDERRALMVAMIASYGMEESQAAQLMSSDPVLITEVLASVRRLHGSVESYLVAHGVPLEDIDALRRELLEAQPGEGASAPLAG